MRRVYSTQASGLATPKLTLCVTAGRGVAANPFGSVWHKTCFRILQMIRHVTKFSAIFALATLWLVGSPSLPSIGAASNKTETAAAPLASDPSGWMPADVFAADEGLPDPTVNTIVAQADGQVWFGTMQGLARQNGRRIALEPGIAGMGKRAVLALATTRTGDLLAAFEGSGVYRRRHGLWQFLGAPFGDHRVRRIRVIAHGSQDHIFVSGDGVARWDGQRWQHLPLPKMLANYEIFDIAMQPATKTTPAVTWLGSFGQGLVRCTGQWACTRVDITGAGPRTNEVRNLLLQPLHDGQFALWAGMLGGGVARLQDNAWVRWHTGNSALPSDFVNELALIQPDGKPSEVWAATRSGLAIMRDGQTWQPPIAHTQQLQANASTDRIRALLQLKTSQGATEVWVGSDGGALRIPLSGPWQLISTMGNRANGVWDLHIEPMTDGQQRVWLASDGEGVARYEHGHWRHYGSADGIPNLTVRSILRVPDGSKDGALWIGTWGGYVLRLQGERFVEVPTPWQKRKEESTSLMLTQGGQLWASTRTQGIARWDGQDWVWMPTGQHAPSRIYGVVMVGQDLWFSTLENGLARYRAGQWRYFQTDIGLPIDALYDLRLIAENGRNLLWVGSNKHGLMRIDISNPEQPRLVTQPALPAQPIPLVYGAVRDGRGDLLVCTDYGVSRWHLTDRGYSATTYHRQDGLPHDECNGGAMQVDTFGRVWIGTVGGAAVFTPPPYQARKPSKLVVSSLLVDGKPIALNTTAIKFPKRDSRLELSLSLFTGEKEPATRYRVQLLDAEGGRGTWGPAESHVLARLPSGRQRIRIEAMDFAGTQAVPITLTVQVPYAWWQTPIARVLMVMAALLLFWGVLRLRLRHLRQQEDLLRSMVNQRTTQLQASEAALRLANDELHRLSYTDPLTGLANRRRLFEALNTQLRNAQTQQRPLGLLMIDLDHFKQLNDSLGHLTGDRCLKEIAQCLLAQLPPQSLAARYGGEEFCVLLPGLDAAATIALAEQLRQQVETLATACCSNHHPHLTISIGAATLSATSASQNSDADGLLAAADRALYAAKASGRNCVRSARE